MDPRRVSLVLKRPLPFEVSEETEDLEMRQVAVEAVVAEESGREEDRLLSCEGLCVAAQELCRRRSISLRTVGPRPRRHVSDHELL